MQHPWCTLTVITTCALNFRVTTANFLILTCSLQTASLYKFLMNPALPACNNLDQSFDPRFLYHVHQIIRQPMSMHHCWSLVPTCWLVHINLQIDVYYIRLLSWHITFCHQTITIVNLCALVSPNIHNYNTPA